MNNTNSFALVVFLWAILCFGTACTQPTINTNLTQTTPAATPASTATIADGDWPGYNRSLTSERFCPLNQITTENVGKLNGFAPPILAKAEIFSVKWKYQSPTPMIAGITATGGGLVLTADRRRRTGLQCDRR